MLTIAQRYGVTDWRTIYDHTENEALRALRPNPRILYPGDLVYIPEGELATHPIRPRQTHRFRGNPVRTRLHVALRREDGETMSGVEYRLEAQGETFESRTGGDGAVEHMVDIRARVGVLQLYPNGRDQPPRVLRLAIGHLDPLDTDSGVRGRLDNLGFRPNEPVEEALRDFQGHASLDQHGQIDDRTRAALAEKHNA